MLNINGEDVDEHLVKRTDFSKRERIILKDCWRCWLFLKCSISHDNYAFQVIDSRQYITEG